MVAINEALPQHEKDSASDDHKPESPLSAHENDGVDAEKGGEDGEVKNQDAPAPPAAAGPPGGPVPNGGLTAWLQVLGSTFRQNSHYASWMGCCGFNADRLCAQAGCSSSTHGAS